VTATPRVSVVVPAWQAEATLAGALASALTQSVPDLEVLVADDGSTDGTVAVARAAAAQDPRVRVLVGGGHGGVAVARNRALDQARGEWVALLDADDRWLPGRLEALLAAGNDVDVVADDVIFDPVPGAVDRPHWRGSVLARSGWRHVQPALVSGATFVELDLGLLKPMVRRAVLDRTGVRYDPALPAGEDFDVAVRLLAAGARWRQLPDGYYLYRVRDGSLSSGATDVTARHLQVVETLERDGLLHADPALAAALRRHGRRSRASLVAARVRATRRRAGSAAAAAELVRQPQDLPLLLGKAGRHLARRLRSRRGRGAG